MTRDSKYTCQCGYPARSADDLMQHVVKAAQADDGKQHGSK